MLNENKICDLWTKAKKRDYNKYDKKYYYMQPEQMSGEFV